MSRPVVPDGSNVADGGQDRSPSVKSLWLLGSRDVSAANTVNRQMGTEPILPSSDHAGAMVESGVRMS